VSQEFLECPCKRRMVKDASGRLIKCENQWATLQEFSRKTYTHQLGILLSDGFSNFIHKILHIAEDCLSGCVYGISMQMFVPHKPSRSWILLYGAQMSLARERAKLLQPCGFALEYNFAAMRNWSPAKASLILDAMDTINVAFRDSTMSSLMASKWDLLTCVLDKPVASPHPARLLQLTSMLDVAMLLLAACTSIEKDHQELLLKVRHHLHGFVHEKLALQDLWKIYKIQADDILLTDENPKWTEYCEAMEVVFLDNLAKVLKILRP